MAGTGSAQVPPRDFQQLRRADGAFVGAVAPGWLGAPYSPAAAIQGRQRWRLYGCSHEWDQRALTDLIRIAPV